MSSSRHYHVRLTIKIHPHRTAQFVCCKCTCCCYLKFDVPSTLHELNKRLNNETKHAMDESFKYERVCFYVMHKEIGILHLEMTEHIEGKLNF